MTSFPITTAQPIEHAGDLPAETDFVVIGGGIIGVTTAWTLAKAGHRVTLLEKGRIAAEQSSRNWGWIRAQGRDLGELPIALEAQRLWGEIAPQLDRDIGLTQGGTLYLAEDEDALGRYQGWLDQARTYQVSSRILTAAAVRDLLPSARQTVVGGLYTPTDCRAEPWLAVPAIARLAAEDGVTIVENCAVRTLDREAGRITGVVTERGRIKTPAVVLAGGAWSSLFLRRHGISLPQLSVRATVAQTEPLPEVYAGGAVGRNVAFRRRADGGYTLAPSTRHDFYIGPDSLRHFRAFQPIFRRDRRSTRLQPMAPRGFPDAWGQARKWSGDSESPFERMRVLNPTPNADLVKGMARDMAAMFPHLGEVRVKTAWAGMIDALPDDVPVVDRVASVPGLTIATGMCGHGFGIGPAFGRIAAELAMGRDPGHDLDRFRFSRFSDGSRIQLGMAP